MLRDNSYFLIIDIPLLLIMGYIGDRFDHRKWMITIAVIWGVTIIPCFMLLPGASLLQVRLVKSWIIMLGVSFSPIVNAWLFRKLVGPEKYLIMGLGYTIGTEILSRKSTLICLSLWEYFNSVIAPAIYIVIVTIIALVSLILLDKNSLNEV